MVLGVVRVFSVAVVAAMVFLIGGHQLRARLQTIASLGEMSN